MPSGAMRSLNSKPAHCGLFFAPRPAGEPLNTPGFLDDENPCLAARVRHMLAADPGEEDIAGFQRRDFLLAGFAVMHVDRAVEVA